MVVMLKEFRNIGNTNIMKNTLSQFLEILKQVSPG
jgi:hypothetical protein